MHFSNNFVQNKDFVVKTLFLFAAENDDTKCTELSRRLQIPVVSIE